MLTNKDYCDYETCVALKELGFSEPTLAYYHGFLPNKPLLYLVIDEDCMPEDGVNVFDLLSNSNKYKASKNIDAPSLYEAQKWLREEKKIDVLVYLDDLKGYFPFIRIWEGSWKTFVNLEEREVEKMAYSAKYEEALSEGIKKAVEILKEK